MKCCVSSNKKKIITTLKYLKEICWNPVLRTKQYSKHVGNADYYINVYLIREVPLDMQAGCGSKIDMFLGYFFIRKCMWSTPGTIKTTAASIKKFYKCMNEHGYVSDDAYNYLCATIKENMGIWQDDCAEYNNFY